MNDKEECQPEYCDCGGFHTGACRQGRKAARRVIQDDDLRALLDYDPDTGVLTWKKRGEEWFSDAAHCSMWNTKFAGRETGVTDNGNGYSFVRILGNKYYTHRLAFFFAHGFFPAEVDHINGQRRDNRAQNLREVTRQENLQNCRRSARNSSGYTGVLWNSTNHNWNARITVGGRNLYLGAFASREDAYAARKAAEKEHHFHHNHGRIL